jgi:hypothetical protein
MVLEVVGAGLGRTGTKSLHTALNMLGFGPCHHMFEVFTRPESMALWIEAGAGRPDWDAIFKEFRSMVDYPGAAFWRELADYYPNAKVLLSVRDPDRWFESTQATIFAPGGGVDKALADPENPLTPFFRSFSGAFSDHIHDHDFMTDYFRRHVAEVKATIAPERLIVYEVGSGWGPLCAGLGVPVPAEPFPSENSRDEFIARVAGMAASPP